MQHDKEEPLLPGLGHFSVYLAGGFWYGLFGLCRVVTAVETASANTRLETVMIRPHGLNC